MTIVVSLLFTSVLFKAFVIATGAVYVERVGRVVLIVALVPDVVVELVLLFFNLSSLFYLFLFYSFDFFAFNVLLEVIAVRFLVLLSLLVLFSGLFFYNFVYFYVLDGFVVVKVIFYLFPNFYYFVSLVLFF